MMSTATYIPETYELEGEDAKTVLAQAEFVEVLKKSVIRFRRADGFSFARSLAFQVVMSAIPGLITVVAIAAMAGSSTVQTAIEESVRSVTPGPAADVVASAFRQAEENAGERNPMPIVAGAFATLLSGVTAMAQLQRGANRIYGVDTDRDASRRYLTAVALALTVGLLLTIAFVALSFGGSIGSALSDEVASTWGLLRWPFGVALAIGSISLIFKRAPNRHQPSMSWLMIGGTMATVAWIAATLGLGIYLNTSASFGDTYGPLAGFIGLMLWAQFSGVALLFGLAFAAQLEGERIGVTEPAREIDKPSLGEFLSGHGPLGPTGG